MDTETDNTLVGIAGLAESPKVISEQTREDGEVQETTLEEMLAESSTELIHTFATSINQSAVKEACKSEEFRQEFKRRLFRVLLRTYVWSIARVTQEAEKSEDNLGRGVQIMMSTGREQERLWGRLTELMAAVKRAVDMFGAGL